MANRKEDEKSYSDKFLEFLSSRAGDRGIMADLRHGFSPATEYRAWPHIAKWCDLTNDRQRKIITTIAAGFAVHKRTAQSGSLGQVMRLLAITGQQNVDEALMTFDARFRRLLACSSAEEVCEHLPGIIKAAERKGVTICFQTLYDHLWHWGERVKLMWARDYWGGEQSYDQAADAGQKGE